MYVWFHRRDLRTTDLTLFDTLAELNMPGLHVMVLDPKLLDERRVREHSGRFFLKQVQRLMKQYQDQSQTLNVLYGSPDQVLMKIATCHSLVKVAYHQDVTPYAKLRDRLLQDTAQACGLEVVAAMDHMLIDADVLDHAANREQPYKVFTPFYNKWKQVMAQFAEPPRRTALSDLKTIAAALEVTEAFRLPSWLEDVLYSTSDADSVFSQEEPLERLNIFLTEKLPDYEQGRDRYNWSHTSEMSGFFNTGTISIRQGYNSATQLGDRHHVESWLRQLAWRDFYLYQALRNPDYFSYEQQFNWTSFDDSAFIWWSEADTGIPIIDAAMTELNMTGRMPNRLRMVTAMFLTKQLLCPFMHGEAYFRDKLADYDHVLNRGGWLWSSSLGYDAAPYFRVMNPVRQSETYDPSGAYIRRWLPKLAHLSDRAIHKPQGHAIVDLKQARLRAIEQYRMLLQQRKQFNESKGIEE